MAQKSTTNEPVHKQAWQTWKRVTGRIGRFQTQVLVTVLYFVVVPVFSLIRFADPLRLKLWKQKRHAPTYWLPRAEVANDLKTFRRQG